MTPLMLAARGTSAIHASALTSTAGKPLPNIAGPNREGPVSGRFASGYRPMPERRQRKEGKGRKGKGAIEQIGLRPKEGEREREREEP